MTDLFHRLRKFIRDDSMSIALLVLFALCAAGQSVTGWHAYAQSLRQAGLPGIGYGAYLRTGNFLDGAFSNWQAAVLQLAVLIAFSSVLRQKGAAHSRKGDGEPKRINHRTIKWKYDLRPVVGRWLYANSLSIVFFAMFAITFALHAHFGWESYNEDQALRHLPPVSAWPYLASASFWFTIFQTWEAEFLAIGVYIVCSIFLRQENSSESKAVEAGNDETGDANE